MGRGVTKGDPVSPTIFNIVVDAVVRAAPLFLWTPGGPSWVHMVLVYHNIFFYADYGWIEGRNQIWVQTSLTAMVRMFERVGIHPRASDL